MRPAAYKDLIAGYTAIDVGRVWGGVAVGLRDGAILALLAAGLSPQEVANLRGVDLVQEVRGLVVWVRRGAMARCVLLDPTQAARLLAWAVESETWGKHQGFIGLKRQAIVRAVARYRDRREGKRR